MDGKKSGGHYGQCPRSGQIENQKNRKSSAQVIEDIRQTVENGVYSIKLESKKIKEVR